MSEDNRSPRDREDPAGSTGDDTEPSPAEADGEQQEEGPVRRPLIRATLTLPEGTPSTPREPPVFTMHQQQVRPGSGQGRSGNWNGRGTGDAGHSNKKKKNAQGRRGSGGGGNKASSRQDQGGSKRASSGRRSSSRRSNKGRPR